MTKNIAQTIEYALETLNPKQKKVLLKRYGLADGSKKTLQEIGDSLDVTRERIRQIENQSIKKIKVTVTKNLGELLGKAKQHLENQGGIRENAPFIQEIKHITGVTGQANNIDDKVKFALLVAGKPLFFKENPNFKSFWYLNENTKQGFFTLIDKTLKLLENTDKQKAIDNKILHDKAIKSISDYQTLSISKKFALNPFGDIGLAKWPEIKPKNIRDKAYLAIKKHGEPIHFEEITKHIHATGISTKPVNVQTVHNELIKDNRFVLVGRGIYALKEHGYQPGTVREVIANIIRSKGPISSTKVINLVNQKRFLKENTILLNLQNRKYFKRLGDGKYDLI